MKRSFGRAICVAAVVVTFATTWNPIQGSAAGAADNFAPTPGLPCLGAGDKPETIQGRAPLADFESGRVAEGYMCNAAEVAHIGGDGKGPASSGGYRVHRYVDRNGVACAFYDTSLLLPANAYATGGMTGVWVLDMTDPAHPVHTATLATPAMQSPHESLSLNARRGLLAAVFSSPIFQPGQFELYDVSQDCRHPTLKSSLPMGVLGHEGSFTPDGRTYYSASLFSHSLTAIDTSKVLAPRTLFTTNKWRIHGLNLSEDGNLLYAADGAKGSAPQQLPSGSTTKGLTVLDVSQIQARALNPQVSEVSHLTWEHVSTPQTNLPVTIDGHKYLVEVDEFGSGNVVGAARIIAVDNPAAPEVVSNIRLAVNNGDHQLDGSQQDDPGASNPLAGYSAHYCAVPSEVDPGIVACSFILSGLRVFDIRDPLNPVEIAYFNKPSTTDYPGLGRQGSWAMSQPAFDVARHQIWYTDANSGFYNVQITSDAWQ